MTRLTYRPATILLAACGFLYLLPAAEGCGDGEVEIGADGTGGQDEVTTTSGAGGNTSTGNGNATGGGPACFVGGCSGQICSDVPDAASDCLWLPEYACYQDHGICEADADGRCGWKQTEALLQCLDDLASCSDPDEPEVCACEAGGGSWMTFPDTCVDLCGAGPGCGDALTDGCDCGPEACWDGEGCVPDERTPVEGQCIRNAGDACETDEDCQSGGCGGELCYNPALSDGVSTCDCFAPPYSCGCVNGSCSWYE